MQEREAPAAAGERRARGRAVDTPGMTKALGRCLNRHTQVVEYDAAGGADPAGVCARCGETLEEWALNNQRKNALAGGPVGQETR